MKIKPLSSGGRSLRVDTEYLKLDIVVSVDGEITVNELEIREPRSLKIKGVGNHFHDLITAKYNTATCSKCMKVINEMNALGPEGCERDRARLIDGIWERRDQLKGWRKIAAKLPAAEKLAKKELNALLDQALHRAGDLGSGQTQIESTDGGAA